MAGRKVQRVFAEGLAHGGWKRRDRHFALPLALLRVICNAKNICHPEARLFIDGGDEQNHLAVNTFWPEASCPGNDLWFDDHVHVNLPVAQRLQRARRQMESSSSSTSSSQERSVLALERPDHATTCA